MKTGWQRTLLALAATAACCLLLYGCAKPKAATPSDPANATQSSPKDQLDVALEGMSLGGLRTAEVQMQSMAHVVHLTGQVSLTESGHSDVTVPLNGVIEKPLVKVGDNVQKGAPLAIVNSVFGQTSLQIMQKLEGDKQALVSAQSSSTQAQTGLGSALSTMMQAATALNQAQDTLHQTDAELHNARKDLKRKRALLKGGVAAESDVEDAHERYQKAISAYDDAKSSIQFFRRSLRAAQDSVPAARQNVSLARDSVTLAQATLHRDTAIFSQSHISGSALPQNLTPVSMDHGSYDKNSSAATTEFYLRAPLSGTVTSVVMTSGQSVSPGTVVASILNTGQVYVDANAFDSDLPFVKIGDPVQAEASSFPQVHFVGRVSYVGRQVDATTHTVAVRSLIHNPSEILKAGTFLSVTLTPKRQRPVLVVPESAVLVHADHHFVFVETGSGHFAKRVVETGISQGGQVEISQGLSAGDKVVTDGNLLLEGQE